MKKEDAVELADKCLKELAASLEQGQTEVLENYLSALARFHDYSFRNMMMIVNQFPEASKVAGFQTWRKLGRCVKKGESGIAILAPMIGRKKNEAESPACVEATKSEAKAVFGFRAVHVFDISQTEGEDLPKLSEISGSAADNLMYLESVYDTLNIKLETRPMPEGTRGASMGGHVVVKEGLDETMRFRILSHELAHLCNEADYVVIMCNVLEGKDRPLWRSTHNSETVQSDLRNAISVGSSCQGFVEADPPTSQAASALAFASRSISA